MENIIAASLIGKFITRAFLLLLLVGAHGTAFSNQMLFSEKVLFVKSHDPREISFVYEDGSKLRGVYSGISWDAVWDLSTASGSQWFNVSYDAENGYDFKPLISRYSVQAGWPGRQPSIEAIT